MGLFGGGGGGGGQQTAGPEAERLAGVQADISKKLFDESSPIRGGAIDQILEALGGVPGQREQLLTPRTLEPIPSVTQEAITANPKFEAINAFSRAQEATARENALGTVARGGTLQGVLGDITASGVSDRVQQFGQLAGQEEARLQGERNASQIIEQLNRGAIEGDLNRTLAGVSQGGFGQTQTAIQANQGAIAGLTQIGANQAAQANAEANRDAGKAGALGQGVGRIGFGLATRNPAAAAAPK